MSSLSKLDYKMDYLVVRNTDGVKRIHLSEISVLMIESTAVSLTAYLLCELNKRKIDIIFCDERRLPYGMLLPLYGSHNASLKLREQIQWKDPVKAVLWAEIVREKIVGQIAVLESEDCTEAARFCAVIWRKCSRATRRTARVTPRRSISMRFSERRFPESRKTRGTPRLITATASCFPP